MIEFWTEAAIISKSYSNQTRHRNNGRPREKNGKSKIIISVANALRKLFISSSACFIFTLQTCFVFREVLAYSFFTYNTNLKPLHNNTLTLLLIYIYQDVRNLLLKIKPHILNLKCANRKKFKIMCNAMLFKVIVIKETEIYLFITVTTTKSITKIKL